MKVTIDQDTCTACGLCADICPEVFEIDDKAVAKYDEVPEMYQETAQEAADSCPVECIHIE